MKVYLQHNGVFVEGFSEEKGKVLYTSNGHFAKQFDIVSAKQFILDHNDKGHGFREENVRVHQIRDREYFNPYKKKKEPE